MDIQDKTKEQLIIELLELKQKFTSLKELYDKEIAVRTIVQKTLQHEKEELEETREKYRGLSEASFESIFISEKGICIEQNITAEEMFGYSLEEAVGRYITDWIVPEYREMVMNKMITGYEQPYEVVAKRKDGSMFPCMLRGKMINYKGKNVHVTSLEDIAESKKLQSEILTDKKRIDSLLTSSTAMIYSSEPFGGFDATYVSENISYITGYSSLDFLSQGFWASKIHPDDAPEIFKNIPKLFENDFHRHQYRFKYKDGSYKWMLDELKLVRDEKGNPIEIRGTWSDINSSKESEENLKNALSLMEATLESIHNGILVVDLEGRVIKTNSKFAELWQIPKDVLDTRDDQKLMNYILGQLDDPNELTSKVSQLYENPVTETLDLIYFKDGRIFEFISKPMYLDGVPNGRVWSFLDITERKHAEEQYHLLANHMNDGVWLMDMDLKVTYQSPSSEKMRGFTLEEFKALPLDKNLAPGSLQMVLDLFQKELPKVYSQPDYNPHYLLEIEYYRKDGSTFWSENNFSFIRNKKGIPVSIIGEGRDITERKQKEKELQQVHRNYETFFNTIDDFLFVLDEHANIIHMNNTVLNRLGYTKEELLGMSVLMVHPPQRRDEAAFIVREMLEGKAQFCPVPIISKSGIQIPVETRVSSGLWNSKPAIFGVTKDISKIRLSEEKFSKVFYLNPSACGLSDLYNHEYIEVNQAFCILLGFDKDEVIGKTAYDLGILTKETADAIMLKADSMGVIVNAEADLKAKNGNIKHVLLSAENIYVQDKIFRYTVVNDITERKRAEVLLKEKSEELDSYFTNALDLFCIANTEGYFLKLNKEWEKTLGFTHNELEGKKFLDLVHPEDLQSTLNCVSDLSSQKNVLNFINRYKTKNGSYRIIEWRSIASGSKIYAAARDVTENKKNEEALKESEEKYRNLFQYMEDGFLHADADGVITLANNAMAKMFKYSSPDAMLGMLSLNLYKNSEDGADLMNVLKVNGKAENYEILGKTKKGNEIWILGNFKVIYNQKGERIGTEGLFRDITDKKKAEEALKSSEARLVELNKAKDKFFSIIAHDLRSPFSGFLGLTQIMSEQISNLSLNELQEISRSMNKSATNLFDLLNNLLEWALMQQHVTNFEPKPLFLLPFATATLQPLLEMASKKRIEVNFNIPSTLTVLADENMLSSIIRNLSSNAVKFTPAGGKASISAKATADGTIEISVKDSGIGMNAEILANMFTLSTSISRKGTDGEPSTGLGLLLCKDFIEKNGGKIWAESEEGKGSTFYFTLSGSFDQEKEEVHHHTIPESIKTNQVSKLKILIAEDASASEKLISIMSRQFSSNILKAHTGIDAVEFCRNNPDIDLILMDIQMPEMHGYEATRQIRQFNKDVIIIAQTAYGLKGDRERVIEAGCNDYISKPINKNELLALIQKYFKE